MASKEALECEGPLGEISAFAEALAALARVDPDDSVMEARELLANMIVSRACKIRRVLFPESDCPQPGDIQDESNSDAPGTKPAGTS